ncbi:MAG: glycerol-3-phosphate 1-O-acyltransferase [Alphaproteobacteria bacterium]|nr:MAG: glycerol-3-phosphate 1-O-acyltransferase [Alphaproteobacteria bacterium]
MTQQVALPLWLVVALAAFALIGIADRVFAPSVRWFFRRRLNVAIDELNQRLDLRIRPFKLTRRQTLVDQLMYDPRVVEAIEAEASERGEPRAVIAARAERYAREIVPAFSATAYFGFGTRAARWLSEFVYRVRLGYSDDAALAGIDPEATVVFVMNHRSNMDYVLVTYMASTRASLSYAVGEWARVFLLQGLIRSMGAYFIRRRSNDPLYRRVLARYVHMATEQGVTQAVFPEGGLSRDGRLAEPRLGLLGYMTGEFDPGRSRDIVFVPVGLNYDRVIEDRVLTAASERQVTGRDFRVRSGTVARFFFNLARLRLQRRLYRYGYACVSFGRPLSFRQWQERHAPDYAAMDREARFAVISRLGRDLMAEIGRIVPALPVALAATVFLSSGEAWLSQAELKSRVAGLIAELERGGAHVHIPRADRDYAVEAGLRMLTLRHLVETNDSGGLRANPAERVLLEYYANSIGHLLANVQDSR